MSCKCVADAFTCDKCCGTSHRCDGSLSVLRGKLCAVLSNRGTRHRSAGPDSRSDALRQSVGSLHIQVCEKIGLHLLNER